MEWWFYTVVHNNHTKPRRTNLWPETRDRQINRILLNGYQFRSDSDVKDAAQLWVVDEPSAFATYGAVHTWDLSQVTSLEMVWCGYTEEWCGKEYIKMQSFNGDLSNWDTANVTNMAATFWAAREFDRNISAWDVSKVTNMRSSKLIHIFENDLT